MRAIDERKDFLCVCVCEFLATYDNDCLCYFVIVAVAAVVVDIEERISCHFQIKKSSLSL